MPKSLTEHERAVAALAWARAQHCAAWWTECKAARASGDHLCSAHRAELDARWKAIREGGC